MQDWLTEVIYSRLGSNPTVGIYPLTQINTYIDLAIKRLNRVSPITEWSRECEELLEFSDVISSWAMVMAVEARIAGRLGPAAVTAKPELAAILDAEGTFFRISADMLSAGKKRVIK